MYRQRFGLTGHPLPKNVQGKTFFDKSPGFKKLERAFRQLIPDPGLSVLTADAGVGKTAALRHLCAQLPKPDYLVIYLCAAVGPFDFYRALALELGLRPAHRRAELWASLKKSLLHLVDERSIAPILILDEAQHLSDTFFIDLSAFLNFAFDSRDLLTLWLVGLPPLARHLRMQQHAPLAMRIVHYLHLEPLYREAFSAMIDHAFNAAGSLSLSGSMAAWERLAACLKAVRVGWAWMWPCRWPAARRVSTRFPCVTRAACCFTWPKMRRRW